MKHSKTLKSGTEKLRDVLPDYYGKSVRIGFTNANGFVFCDIVDDNIAKRLMDEQDTIYNYCSERLNLCETELRWLKNAGISGYVDRCFLKSYVKKNRQYYEKRYKSTIKSYEKSVSKYKRILKKKNYILNTCVSDVYKSIDPLEPDTYIIMCEGEVCGNYWNRAEYLELKVEPPKITNEYGMHRLTAAVVKQAASDDDKSFFLSEDFNTFMPQYDGEAIWKQIRQNYHESMGQRWYANKNEDLDL